MLIKDYWRQFVLIDVEINELITFSILRLNENPANTKIILVVQEDRAVLTQNKNKSDTHFYNIFIYKPLSLLQ